MEYQTHIRRLEQVNEDLRRRNGELYNALETLEAAHPLTPVEGTNTGPLTTSTHRYGKNFPTRYVILDRIVTIATELGLATLNNPDPTHHQTLLEELATSVQHHQNYWELTHQEREARKERGRKARAKRQENNLTKNA